MRAGRARSPTSGFAVPLLACVVLSLHNPHTHAHTHNHTQSRTPVYVRTVWRLSGKPSDRVRHPLGSSLPSGQFTFTLTDQCSEDAGSVSVRPGGTTALSTSHAGGKQCFQGGGGLHYSFGDGAGGWVSELLRFRYVHRRKCPLPHTSPVRLLEMSEKRRGVPPTDKSTSQFG